MKRKLIRQGKGGFTLTVPIKWVKENRLKAGDEIDLAFLEDNLLISTQKRAASPQEIELSIKDVRESAVRTLLVNAYRAGYDRINIKYLGKEAVLTDIIKELLIGFELFSKDKGDYLAESVAEPSYDNFEKLVEKQFFILSEILRNIESSTLKQEVYKVQKYDNFIKRCLSKGIFKSKALPFLWQFLSSLTQIARQCYHLNKFLLKNKTKLNKIEEGFVKEVETMFLLLQKAYLTKNFSLLTDLHEKEEEIVHKKGPELIKKHDPVKMSYLIYLARLVYLANSPLTGLLQLEQMQKSS